MTPMRRRSFLMLAGAAAISPQVLPAAAQIAGPFTLPPLGYAPDANEPHIDAQTMTIHHDKHHAAYVANLNAAVKDYGQVAALPVETILAKLGEMPDAIRTALRNNAGGHANHTMFWTLMGGKGGTPTGPLAAAIARDFGNLSELQAAFNKAGLAQFGSGFVFVTVTKDGKLALSSRPNQDTPLMEGGRVLLANDVWEHAYYLKYQNRRADYLTAWWNTLNWPQIESRYAAALAGTLTI